MAPCLPTVKGSIATLVGNLSPPPSLPLSVSKSRGWTALTKLSLALQASSTFRVSEKDTRPTSGSKIE